MKFRYLYIGMMVAASLLTTSCDEKWENEQYIHYVSFKAPVENSTVTRVRVKYKGDVTNYKLPLLVSGSLNNTKNLEVHVGLDSDTLNIYNQEHFGSRKDLWYKELHANRYVFNPVTTIPAGANMALVDIQLNLADLDLSENWVLPLLVEDDPTYNYQSNPRLGYNNALLWITPFNDYSGTYGASTLTVTVKGNTSKLQLSNRAAQVVDENSIFFYAGAIDENRVDRKFFKIKATFIEDTEFVPETNSQGVVTTKKGAVKLEAMNNMYGFEFVLDGEPTYVVTETMDKERPTLMRRLTTISGINYTFTDSKETATPITYLTKGSMSLQRNINTTIDDEELSIEW